MLQPLATSMLKEINPDDMALTNSTSLELAQGFVVVLLLIKHDHRF